MVRVRFLIIFTIINILMFLANDMRVFEVAWYTYYSKTGFRQQGVTRYHSRSFATNDSRRLFLYLFEA